MVGFEAGEGRVCAGWSEEVERGEGLWGEELEVVSELNAESYNL
jgi:hypothetical protein